MKKVLIILISSLILLGACRREKSYTCECTYIPNPPNYGREPSKIEMFTVIDKERLNADIKCNEVEIKYPSFTGTCILTN